MEDTTRHARWILITPKHLRSKGPPERLDGVFLPTVADKCKAWYIREKAHRLSQENSVNTDEGLNPSPGDRWEIENFAKTIIGHAKGLAWAWIMHVPRLVHQEAARKMQLITAMPQEEVELWLRFRGYEVNNRPHPLQQIAPAF